jgi:hypothetical protein
MTRSIFFPSLLLALILLASASRGDEPRIGDTREVVIKKIGKPVGRLSMGDKEILSYPRGFVEFRDGGVTAVKMIGAEEAAALQQKREQAALSAATESAQRVQEGKDERNRLMEDPDFANKSAAEKVAVWEEFRRKYPDVSVPDEYNQAVGQARTGASGAAPEVTAEERKPKPKLSSSKRRRYVRAHDTNMVDFGESPGQP